MAGVGGGVDDNTAQGNHLVVEHDVANALTAPATGGPRLDSGQAEGGQLVVQDIPDQVSTLNSQGNGGHRLDVGEAAGGHLIAMNLLQDPVPGDASSAIGVATFQKVHRSASTDDPEKWEARDVAATLNQFDTGDTRAVDVIVQPVTPTLESGTNDTGGVRPPGSDEQLVAIQPLLEVDGRTGKSTDDPRAGIGIGDPGDPMYTLQAGKQHGVHAPDQTMALAYRGREGGSQLEWRQDGTFNALRAGDGGSSRDQQIFTGTVVRRLTPTECERLQGMPDDHTRYRVDLKEGSRTFGEVVEQSDSARYKQIGNAVAVPVVEWIIHRLVAIS